MTAEERARTLTGRHQISDDGRHLVDGVPFGRPYLRHPNRPAVRIPPRKRRRLDDAEEGLDEVGLRTANGGVPPRHERAALLSNGDVGAGSDRQPRTTRPSKTVQFGGTTLDDGEDSDEDDDDFAPDGEQDDDAVMDDDSEDDSDSDSDSASASDTSSASGSDSDSDSDDSSSGSDSDSGSDASSPPEVRSSKGVLGLTRGKRPSSREHVAPGYGRPGTRSRNSRRTRSNRLRFLKAAGKLPPDADLKALDQYEGTLQPQESPEPEPSKPFSTYAGKRKRVDDEQAIEEVTELEQRKQELMARFGKDTGSTMVQVEESLQTPDAAAPTPSPPQTIQTMTQEEQPAKATSKKRLRPDTSAISRILARQAMVRVVCEHTKEEANCLQPSKRSPKSKPVVEKTPEPEGAFDPDFWKSRINLSAFECWEEDFELSAPPFPFQQHWDPASKAMRAKAENKKQKRGGKKQRESLPVEEEEEEKIFLDYDDTGATEKQDSEINAAIEEQLSQDVATAAQPDLPALPDDLSTLPDLTSGDVKAGAVIACKFFDINPITMTPEISGYKTALVKREGDSGYGAGTIRLKIAERDLPKREKKFDKKGNRIYDAADQFYVEDDDEETGLWEGQLAELLEPKLVKAA